MTDTARHADVVLPATTQLEHLDALFSWGHHYVTYNEPGDRAARRGEAEHRDLPAARARAWGSTTRASATPTRSCSTQLLAGAPAACRSSALRERGWLKIDLGQGPRRTPRAASGRRPAGSAARRLARRRGVDPLPFYDAPAEVADAALGAALPARADHAEDAPVPQLDLRQPAPPALGPAGAVRRRQPGRRRAARARRRRARAGLQRSRLVRAAGAGLRRRPPRRASSRRWAGGTATTPAAAAPRRRPRSAHRARRGADVQRQPRRGRGAALTLLGARARRGGGGGRAAAEREVRLPDRRRLSAAAGVRGRLARLVHAASPRRRRPTRSVTSTPSRPRRRARRRPARRALNWPGDLVLS